MEFTFAGDVPFTAAEDNSLGWTITMQPLGDEMFTATLSVAGAVDASGLEFPSEPLVVHNEAVSISKGTKLSSTSHTVDYEFGTPGRLYLVELADSTSGR